MDKYEKIVTLTFEGNELRIIDKQSGLSVVRKNLTQSDKDQVEIVISQFESGLLTAYEMLSVIYGTTAH